MNTDIILAISLPIMFAADVLFIRTICMALFWGVAAVFIGPEKVARIAKGRY